MAQAKPIARLDPSQPIPRQTSALRGIFSPFRHWLALGACPESKGDWKRRETGLRPFACNFAWRLDHVRTDRQTPSRKIIESCSPKCQKAREAPIHGQLL